MKVAGTRRRGRELAVQALYELELAGADGTWSPEATWRHFGEPEAAREFGRDLVHGVRTHGERIDALISASSQHWRLGRLSNVDRSILRVGAYELLCRPDVPTSVVIDEAIEIAKRFGGDESSVFVNGVLDQVAASVGAKEGRSVV
jgi:N utilization substance protein B